MDQNEPLGCSLDARDLAHRMREWSHVAARALSSHVEGSRIIAIYPNDPGLLQRLRELITAEARCCPFMKFNLQESVHEVVVELRLPDKMTETDTIMLGLVMIDPLDGAELECH